VSRPRSSSSSSSSRLAGVSPKERRCAGRGKGKRPRGGRWREYQDARRRCKDEEHVVTDPHCHSRGLIKAMRRMKSDESVLYTIRTYSWRGVQPASVTLAPSTLHLSSAFFQFAGQASSDVIGECIVFLIPLRPGGLMHYRYVCPTEGLTDSLSFLPPSKCGGFDDFIDFSTSPFGDKKQLTNSDRPPFGSFGCLLVTQPQGPTKRKALSLQ